MPATSNLFESLVWAALILGVAFLLQANGVSSTASAGIVFGLSGAALGTLSSDGACAKRCLM